MARRGENIRKRKDGYWEGRYIVEYTSEGKAKYKSIYRKTYSEVKEALKNAKNSKPLTYSHITMEELCVMWLHEIKITVKESTYAKYHNIIHTHMIPSIGGIKIRNINQSIIDNVVKEKSENGRVDKNGGLSPKTVNDYVSLLKQLLKYAEYKRYIENGNYNITKPKQKKNTITVLTKHEQDRLKKYLLTEVDNAKLGVLICLYTGLRLGEVCALTWDDVNLDAGVIMITKTMQRIKNTDPSAPTKTKIVIDAPKSENSCRAIPIPSFLIQFMKEHEKGNKHAYFLTGRVDKFMEPRVLQYKFKFYLKDSGLDDVNFHALRHTFATKSIECQTDLKTLSEILGHANVNLTLNTYIHSSMEQKKKCIEKVAYYY